jgi:nucleotide-binding universal stress UspA family protein
MTATDPATILIGYDGSDGARRAIEEAGRLFPGAPALVVTAWASVHESAPAARMALGEGLIAEAARDLDAAAEQAATEQSEEGARLARDAGLAATGTAVRSERAVWATLAHAADTHDARAIVVGSRGLSGLRAMVLGSVSNALVHQCRRPVVVVHPPE